MLKRDLDQQRTKAISKLEERYAYWKPGNSIFDKPKKRLIEFYDVWQSLKEETDTWMGRLTKSMVPSGLPITVMIVYGPTSTYMCELGEQIVIYEANHKDLEIKRK